MLVLQPARRLRVPQRIGAQFQPVRLGDPPPPIVEVRGVKRRQVRALLDDQPRVSDRLDANGELGALGNTRAVPCLLLLPLLLSLLLFVVSVIVTSTSTSTAGAATIMTIITTYCY